MYAYAQGERSSRGIERRCVEDVAYRVIACQQTPDHATIARFRVRHEAALAGLFGEVLGLCRESGLAKVGLIAIDGTKVHANASHHSNVDYEQLAREILKEAGEIDAAEDALYGQARGDELPEHLRTREGRRAALRAAKERLARERTGREDAETEAHDAKGVELVFDPEVIVARVQGREGWVREARHQLDEHRRLAGDPIPRSRSERLLECERRMQENLRVEREANEAYEHHRATGVSRDGRRFGARPNPYVAPELPPGKINVTDLDSRNVKTPRSYTQGYNVQAVVNEHQVVLAAEVTLSSPDFGHLEPMVSATRRELEQIGVSHTPGVAVADSGYWHEQQIDAVVNMGTQVLIAPDAGKRETPRRAWNGGRYAFMRRVDQPVPATRQIRGTLGVAADHRDSQPAEAPQAPPGPPGGLKRPSAARRNRSPHWALSHRPRQLCATPTTRRSADAALRWAGPSVGSGGQRWVALRPGDGAPRREGCAQSDATTNTDLSATANRKRLRDSEIPGSCGQDLRRPSVSSRALASLPPRTPSP